MLLQIPSICIKVGLAGVQIQIRFWSITQFTIFRIARLHQYRGGQASVSSTFEEIFNFQIPKWYCFRFYKISIQVSLCLIKHYFNNHLHSNVKLLFGKI